ncbi:MAG: sulfite exporter TauE/SafE family protein [Pseudomonadales bacterium]|nr:sulfite exporter TauE/SafE family protein [Pseudomonadales bacterium]
MITDPFFYALAIPAVLIVGIAKGGLGGGIGILGVPLMALAAGPVQAAAIMLPLLMVMDAFAVHRWWRQWDLPNLWVLLPGATVGIVVGTFTFRYLSDDHIRVLIGLIAVVFVGLRIVDALSGRGGPPPGRPARPIAGTFWGAVAGFTSFGVHAGGPPVNVYLLRQGLSKSAFQATSVAFFAVVNWIKLPPYAWLGQLEIGNLTTSLVLAPLAPVGIRLGAWLHHRIDETWFFRFVYFSLAVVGVRLIWLGLT